MNLSIRWTHHGIEYECDHRHAGERMEELELRPGQKVVAPVVRESRKGRKRDAGQQKKCDQDGDFDGSGGQGEARRSPANERSLGCGTPLAPVAGTK